MTLSADWVWLLQMATTHAQEGIKPFKRTQGSVHQGAGIEGDVFPSTNFQKGTKQK